ncbi:RBM41 [Bugula neritina]|uniref:RBM41 n=1 Tax=Bugula neritina TaxID=10212 RepID=A0A7J7KIS5_BUGNE|nr:RBM41 [Bugula neritina]
MSRRKIDESSRKTTPSGMAILKRVRLDDAPVEKIISETDEQIQKLYETQTSIDVSLDGVRSRFKEFKEPSVFKQSSNEVKGEQSLVAYKTLANERENVQELRNCGLRDDEIELWMSQFEKQKNLSISKINPDVLEQRLAELGQRIRAHDERVQSERGFSTAKMTSRLKLELEKSLNQGRTEQAALSSLVMKAAPASDTGSTPESQLQQIASELSEKRPSIPDYGHPFPNPWVPVTPKLAASAEFVGPKPKDADLDVSDEDLVTNRLTIAEVKQLPKFANYHKGQPSPVLYVKNLGSTVKQEHLMHLFGRFRVPGDKPITCKLMTGRMRGQAFITCADIETASRCLHALIGYKLRGRPMIISYKQPHLDKTTPTTQ